MAEQAGKVGAVYSHTGTVATLTDKPIGTGDAANVTFYLQEVIADCEAVSPTAAGSLLAGDWTSSGATAETLTADNTDEKEGTYCIKNNVTEVYDDEVCLCLFTMDAAQDWHDRARIMFWVRCELASTDFENARFEVLDNTNGYRSYWNLTFAAATWTRVELLLGSPDGNSGTAADLTDIDVIQLSFEAEDSDTFYQEIDWIGITPQAVDKSITVKVAGTALSTSVYTHTVSGVITCASAPAGSAAVLATYDEYAIEQIGGFFNWNIAQAVTTLDKTDFQSSSGWKEFLGGLKEWSATAERHWITDESLTSWLGVARVIKLFLDSDADPQLRYEGWAIIKGLNPGVAVDTIIDESLDFQGTGQLSYEST